MFIDNISLQFQEINNIIHLKLNVSRLCIYMKYVE